MLILAITILNIFAAIALPLWSYTIRRDREEETIFRGLQYAEAIRVFRQRNGRYPIALDELVKIEPRSIRQLWTEPLSEDGEFGLVIEAPQPQPGQPGQPGAPGTPGASPTPQGQPVTVPNRPGGGSFGGFGIGGSGGVNLIKLPRAAKDSEGKTVAKLTTQVPVAIHGVYLDKTGESLRKFFGKDKYQEWTFTAELITAPVTAPGRPLPSVSDYWLGRSFPDGLNPSPGGAAGPGAGIGLGSGQPGQPAAPGIPQGVGPGGVPSDGEPPVAEPDTPSEFPEDFPEEETPDEDVDEEPPPDEPSDPSEPPDPDGADAPDGADPPDDGRL